jgi:phosphoglycolate phosphatase-like HAD superfamily hydrolase
MDRLVLFDVDATLITTGGVGVLAMQDAGRELFGKFSIDALDFAGRLDPLLIREMLRLNGVALRADTESVFRLAYMRHLRVRLDNAPTKRTLPGVRQVVDRLREESGVMLGLLTGNFEESGRMKLEACGLNTEHFTICAWGDDSPHDPPDREHLPPIAMERFRTRVGRAIDARGVTIIGDTRHDIRCAKASGCRVIAVATGRSNIEQLSAHNPDLALKDLSDHEQVVSWIMGG